MNEQLEQEWKSKIDFPHNILKEPLSEECYQWASKNHKRTEEIMNEMRNEQKREDIIKAKEELSKCYYDIIDFMDEWIDINPDYKKIIAIWIIGTYFHKSFNTFPYLFLNAMRGSGKTRLLNIISWLQYNGNGEVLTNPSDAVIFRTAKERGIILDEFESQKSKDKQAMREYMNACYKKGGMVYRMEKERDKDGKEKQVAKGHSLFTPIAMANINGIEDVLADRSISLILEKSMNPILVKKIEDFSSNFKLQDLKVRLNKFCIDFMLRCNVMLMKGVLQEWNLYINERYTTSLHTIHTLHNSTSLHDEIFRRIDETGIYGRNLELFFPLLLTAKEINTFIFDDILKVISKLNSAKKEDEFAESKDVTLIEYVSLCERYQFEMIYLNDFCREFKEFAGQRGEEDEITSIWVGLALKRLKLVKQKTRVSKGIMIHLDVSKAKEKILMFKADTEVKDG